MNDRKATLARDLAAMRYVEAWEAEDWDALAALWGQAYHDPALEHVLCELSEGLAAEQEPSPGWQADAARVRGLLGAHLPSSAAAPPPESAPVSLVTGDVAARIAGDAKLLAPLTAEERQANAALLADRTPLPPQLGVPELEQWTAALPVRAGAAYWRVFRQTAILLTMSRAPKAAQGISLAAARPATGAGQPPPPRGQTGGPRS